MFHVTVKGILEGVSHSEPVPAFVHDFFVQYAERLLARDVGVIAELYAVPALILFPGNPIPAALRFPRRRVLRPVLGVVEGVYFVTNEIILVGEAPSSLWVDATWSYDGEVRERSCYQLIEDAGEWRIAVLTPLAV